MHDVLRFSKDFFALLIVAFPPFIYLLGYIKENVKNRFIKFIICTAYWAGTLLLSNTVPAAAVLFLIYNYRNKRVEPGNEYENSRSVSDYNKSKWSFSIKDFIQVFLWGIVIKAVVTYINYAVILLLSRFNIPLENQDIINQFLKSNKLQCIMYLIAIVICAPVVEEFVFRFYLYDHVLKKRVGRALAVFLSSLIFAIAHFNLQGATAFFLIGAVNCYLYEKKGYFAAVTNHFVFNFTSALMLVAARAFNLPI